MEAPIPQKCSYAWQSILQAREVIEKCAIWRVGNGHEIKVWKHIWLPDPTYKKIITPQSESTITRVSELFYSNTRIWDLGELEESFYPWEAKLVSWIQVGKGRDKELLVWPLTVYGTYSVRSAYHFLALTKASNSPSSSMGTEQQRLWKFFLENTGS